MYEHNFLLVLKCYVCIVLEQGFKVKGGKRYHPNTNQKETEVAMLILDKANFRTRKIIRDKEAHLNDDKMVNSPRRYNNLNVSVPIN